VRKKSTAPKTKPLYQTPLEPLPDLGHVIPAAPLKLHEDWSVSPGTDGEKTNQGSTESLPATGPELLFRSETPFVRLYHGNCLELLDAIAAKYPEGRFDAIFADPPYFLSNGGITCHAGKMVKVDKGEWDKSRGPEMNHEFNLEWLRRCQRVLKPNGTIWVSGTYHVIFSIGYAMQQLGYKILNDIAWEKPNPPPNLSCRYFTHSTETILWAARDEKSKHLFNYQEMRKVTGKQMKTVWTMTAPRADEKTFGKHPTQKPLALIERCLLASTNESDLVLDPFLGGGTTAIAAIRLQRGCIGIELDFAHLTLASDRADREIIEIWLRHYAVHVAIVVYLPPENSALSTQNFALNLDLDLFGETINGSREQKQMPNDAENKTPHIPTERIYHETKFVFLSCAEVERGSVVHTTVDVSLQEAWAKTPTGKKRETTHVVRCETEIFRVETAS
jgi:site-specific DNA-methyltransferase (adenine-specific)